MAKRAKRVLRARKETREDDSLLVRSAESLGRVIGSLQRQLKGTSKRASAMADNAMKGLPDMPRMDTVFGNARSGRKTKAARATKARRSASRKTASTSRSRPRSGTRASSKKR